MNDYWCKSRAQFVVERSFECNVKIEKVHEKSRNHFNQTISLSDEFRSKVACENDVIQLMCNPYSRIAIYGASYGRTEYESLTCAQPSGIKEDYDRKIISTLEMTGN